MYTSIVICVLLLQLLIFRDRYKYFITPPILLTSIWIAVHILNLLLGWQIGDVEYLILLIPPIMFCLGFCIFARVNIGFNQIHHMEAYNKDRERWRVNYNALLLILIIESILMMWSLKIIFEASSKLANANFWLNIHESASIINSNFLLTYSIPATYIFSGFCGLLYLENKNKKMGIIYIAALVIAVIRAFMAGNRSALLMVIIINIFPLLLNMQGNMTVSVINIKKKTRKLLILAIFMSAVMFFGIASQKYSDQLSNLSLGTFLLKNFTGYFNLSSAAFVEWYKQNTVHTNGANTFRFFFAILNRIGVSVPVADINSNFISINGTVTNAFTVAKIYVEDYGVVFMAVMMFIYGAIHAHFYKRIFFNDYQKRMSGQLFCGVLYIGLLYQILVDQYVSILSMMLSFYIWSFVFPRLLIKKSSIVG